MAVLVEVEQMIRQLGTHVGKTIVFGFDRYLLPELDEYLSYLGQFGEVVSAVDPEYLHYLSSAQRVCERVQGRPDHVGVLCCGTGMGMSIAANKFRGIYAGRCMTAEDSQLARAINNANVLCLASSSGFARNAEVIDSFMNTPFEGRKLEQLAYIAELELEQGTSPRQPNRTVPHPLRKTA